MSKIGRNGLISGFFFKKKWSGKNKMVQIGLGAEVRISFLKSRLFLLENLSRISMHRSNSPFLKWGMTKSKNSINVLGELRWPIFVLLD